MTFSARWFWILFLALPAKAESYFYQTAFVAKKAYPELSWQSLGLSEEALTRTLSSLTGKAFKERPPEWWNYFDDDAFEDEALSCLTDSARWSLVSLRIIPKAINTDYDEPQVRLSFQSFCLDDSSSSDTSIQIILNAPAPLTLDHLILKASALKLSTSPRDLGFVEPNDFDTSPDWPGLITDIQASSWSKNLRLVLKSGAKIKTIKWMASSPGQLDWVFGELKVSNDKFADAPLELRGTSGESLIELGFFDFLPLSLRAQYSHLPDKARAQLDSLHVMEDPHESPESARKVLEKDLLVANPWRVSHSQVSCTQCHSGQERMIRSLDYLDNGSVREFGYFFRGLGLMGNQLYVSWRSVQESRYLSQQLQP